MTCIPCFTHSAASVAPFVVFAGCDSPVVASPPENAESNVTCQSEAPWANGTQCSLSCSAGYSGTVSAECQYGTWTATGTCSGVLFSFFKVSTSTRLRLCFLMHLSNG